ncbi:MAG: acetyltransferase [Mycobacterium sp.]|nr:acetyltransferase [Mycobacterium sp.]
MIEDEDMLPPWPQPGHPFGVRAGDPQLPFIAGRLRPIDQRSFVRRVYEFYEHHHARYQAVLVLARHVGVRRARTALVRGERPWTRIRGTLVVGDDLHITGTIARCGISVDQGATLTFGDHVWFQNGVRIHARESVTFGSRILIGESSSIYDSTFHAVQPGTEARTAPIVIEDDVWIARECYVGPGVRIGRGSVLGTGTALMKSVPPGSVVVGTPGRVVDTFEVPQDFRRV